MAFHWRADDGPLKVVFISSPPSSTKIGIGQKRQSKLSNKSIFGNMQGTVTDTQKNI